MTSNVDAAWPGGAETAAVSSHPRKGWRPARILSGADFFRLANPHVAETVLRAFECARCARAGTRRQRVSENEGQQARRSEAGPAASSGDETNRDCECPASAQLQPSRQPSSCPARGGRGPPVYGCLCPRSKQLRVGCGSGHFHASAWREDRRIFRASASHGDVPCGGRESSRMKRASVRGASLVTGALGRPHPRCWLAFGALIGVAAIMSLTRPFAQTFPTAATGAARGASSVAELMHYLKTVFHSSPLAYWRPAASLVFSVVGLAAGVVVLASFLTGPHIVEESLEVVANFGVQLQHTTRWGGVRREFIEASQVSDVIINEGFRVCDIIFYVALLVKDRPNMVVPFQQQDDRHANIGVA
ncbi:hypothetical protein BESB_082560 [Besnoitia besnoiti]|uniref:Phosphatidylinositol N-acetylglucosaminyltransferase subunit H conserved domain-containing protein n=1 Tax=Besnoitia besnoiti TaxID=94643 RepID=A0A2A9MBR5_BESBE|nr:hypothetical protein BESB_082560 [Besnoitia besnoiti]PFH33057.1 hypothetical protein BESB_082560 [Besnoitia besnoiti]